MIEIQSEKEKETLAQFKTNVDDLNQPEETLLRFLRARNHDLKKSEEMLRNCIQWREENNIGSYLDWKPPQPLADDMKFECTGHTAEGNPIISMPMGRWNPRELVDKGLVTKDDLIKFRYHMLETLMKWVQDSGGKQMVVICGQENLSYYKVASLDVMSLWFASFQEFEKYFPEILHKAFVINSPWIFTYAFKFLKPAFTGSTLSKIQIFDSDKSKWMEALREIIPEECVPSIYKDEAQK